MDCQVLVFFAGSCYRGEECGGQEQAARPQGAKGQEQIIVALPK